MSVLAYPRTNDEEIFRQCTKDCGVVTATEDFQYFALRCIFCSEKFLYFDAFIGHMQTVHLEDAQRSMEGAGSGSASSSSMCYNMGLGLGQPMSLGLGDCDCDDSVGDNGPSHGYGNGGIHQFDEIEDLTDADTALLEPQMVIKQELQELESSDIDDNDDNEDNLAVPDDNDTDNDNRNDADDDSEAILPESVIPAASVRSRLKLGPPTYLARHVSNLDVKNEPLTADGDDSMDDYVDGDQGYTDDNSGEYPDYNSSSYNTHGNGATGAESDFLSYDEMVEESLLGVSSTLFNLIKPFLKELLNQMCSFCCSVIAS